MKRYLREVDAYQAFLCQQYETRAGQAQKTATSTKKPNGKDKVLPATEKKTGQLSSHCTARRLDDG